MLDGGQNATAGTQYAHIPATLDDLASITRSVSEAFPHEPLAGFPSDFAAAYRQATADPLQAHLYLVALHRYLRWRLPGYRPEQHLGGYVYVFLRGVTGPTTASAVPGMFVEQPPLARLLQLDQALGGTP